ncbi:MAG: hypothetical protein PUH33_05465 [Clostridiaceae bacterium]|nr:hypothetical protein [Clostridiaceae bacterium]
MKKFKILYGLLISAAVLLFGAMCATVAYSYCDMFWGIKYECFSAPASVAFIYAVPFAAVIALILISAAFVRKKALKKP